MSLLEEARPSGEDQRLLPAIASQSHKAYNRD